MRLGLEGGDGSTSVRQLGSSVQRSESKLNDSYLSRSNSAIGRSDSALSRSSSRIGRNDSAISSSGISRSDSAISDSALPSITPRSARAAKGSSKFVPQIDFNRINGGTSLLFCFAAWPLGAQDSYISVACVVARYPGGDDDLEDTDEELYAPTPDLKPPAPGEIPSCISFVCVNEIGFLGTIPM